MQTRIFLVRHGQTEWNVHHRLQGHKNSPLTTEGKNQAHQTQHALQEMTFHRAYVSPLQRARQTLDIIVSGKKIEIIPTEGLKEIRLGVWEGKTREETKKSHPEQYVNFWHQQEKFVLQGAETFQQLQARVVHELDVIFYNNRGKNILVVSHWIAIKVALTHYLSLPLRKLSSIADPGNGSFLVLEQDKDNKVTLKADPEQIFIPR